VEFTNNWAYTELSEHNLLRKSINHTTGSINVDDCEYVVSSL